jgi:hypothetical protein
MEPPFAMARFTTLICTSALLPAIMTMAWS